MAILWTFSGMRIAAISDMREPADPPTKRMFLSPSALTRPTQASAFITDSVGAVKPMSEAPQPGRSHSSTR